MVDVDVIGDAVVAIDRTGRITYANVAAARMLDAAVGRDLRQLVGDGPWLAGSPAVRAEVLVTLRGVPRIIADTTTPLADGGAAIVMRDVTEHVVAARRASRAEHDAAAATASSALAHRVNNPLAVILVHAEFVREELTRLAESHVEEAASIGEALASQLELERAAATIGKLMSDLRAFSQAGAAEAGAQRAVDYAARTAGTRARDRARIVTHVELDAPIGLDEASLGVVLIELIANAAAAIEPGAADKHEIHVGARRDGAHAIIEVRDTGRGMQAQPTGVTLAAMPTGGVHVGLGLVRCRELVGSVGGTLHLEAGPEGIGTVARVTLPLAVVPTKARVLVVDPDGAHVRSVRRALREHEVTACASAAEALAHLEHDARFDLVLADVGARELYSEVLAHHPALAPRIAFTSAAVSDGCLTKPIEATTLRTLLGTVSSNES
jgi:two-component system, NtrC family, sensor kinase